MTTGPLDALLADGGVLRKAYDEHDPVLLPGAVVLDEAGLPTARDLTGMLEASLLRWPYFTVFHDGVRPPRAEITRARRVGGGRLDGFVDADGVRRHLDDGATLKLSQVEDWHAGVAGVVARLRAAFPAEVTSFLFLTPCGKRGMLPHRDAGRVLVIQLEGTKEWHLYGHGPAENPEAGLDVDPATESQVLLLEPGDVLYLPHACGHAATAVDSSSLHLTFTLAEPTPAALLEAHLGAWAATEPGAVDLVGVLARLRAAVGDLAPEDAVAAALARGGSA